MTDTFERLTDVTSTSITPEDVVAIVRKLREARQQIGSDAKSSKIQNLYFEVFWIVGPILQNVVNVWNELRAEELKAVYGDDNDDNERIYREGRDYLFSALERFCLCPFGLPKECNATVKQMIAEEE